VILAGQNFLKSENYTYLRSYLYSYLTKIIGGNLMVRMTGVSRRLRQTQLLIMLSLLVWIICLLSVWVHFLPDNKYGTRNLSSSEQSISSINPVVARATNELAKYIHLSTDRVTNTAKGLIDEESDKAETKFKSTVSAIAEPAPGLHNAIRATLVHNLCNALGEE
jgi:hypothetical protein